MWTVSSPYDTVFEHATNNSCAVGLAMLNDEPVVVDIIDANSALDSDANFTGEKKRVAKVIVVESMSVRLIDKYRSYCRRSVPLKPAQSTASGSTTLTTQ